jgi:hypothetical protein
MNVQSHSSFYSTIFYMTPTIYKPSPFQLASQDAQEALNFAQTADKFLSFFDVNPKVRKNIQIAMALILGAAITAALVRAVSK